MSGTPRAEDLEDRIRGLEAENDRLARTCEYLCRTIEAGARERGRLSALLTVVFDALQKASPEEAAPFEEGVSELGVAR